jgi:predicted PurR-regulated permease PerM
VKAVRAWLVTLARQGAGVLLLTAVSLVLAAVLLTRRASAAKVAVDVGARIAGEAGVESVRLAGQTIESVVKGVVGVAPIQAALAAAGLVAAGVPGAGLWASWS